MEQIKLIPGVDEPLGYRSFCELYLEYRDGVKKESEQLLHAAQQAENTFHHIEADIEHYPDVIRTAKMDCKKKEQELASLKEAKQQVEGSVADFAALLREEESARNQIASNYRSQEHALRQQEENIASAREQNKLYLDTLERYRQLYKDMKPYREDVLARVANLKTAYPTMAQAISDAVSQPVQELTEGDFNFVARLEAAKHVEGVFEPIKLREAVNYVIAPSQYPYRILEKTDFKRTGIACLAVLVLGILGGLLVHPILNPLSIVAAILLVNTLVHKHKRLLQEQVDWPMLRLYNTILMFREENIELLARKKADLPIGSSSLQRESAAAKLQMMRQSLEELKDSSVTIQRDLADAQRAYDAQEEEWQEITAQAQKPNSRLNTALQKKRNGLELTSNQAMLVQEYDARTAQCRTKLEQLERQVNDLLSCKKQNQLKIQILSQEIVEYQEKSEALTLRLEQLEQVTDDNTSSLQTRINALHTQQQQELDSLKAVFSAKREQLEASHSEKIRRQSESLEAKIRRAEKELHDLQQKQQTVEENHRDAEHILHGAKKDAENANTRYRQKQAQLQRLNSPEVWEAHTSHWRSVSAKDAFSDVTSFAIANSSYVMGPDGPYLLQHNNRPCVLLYEDNREEYRGLTPSELLKNTIGAICAGLQLSNLPGLTEFAVVNEYSDDSSLPSFIQCYGKSTTEELNRRVDSMRADLQRETQFGNTVNTFNTQYAKQMQENGITNQKELLRLMKKALYVFVLPTPGGEQRPLNHDRLWEKIRGNCYDYGFVPIFLIPKDRWNAVQDDNSSLKNGFLSAVQQLQDRASLICEIPLNKVK